MIPIEQTKSAPSLLKTRGRFLVRLVDTAKRLLVSSRATATLLSLLVSVITTLFISLIPEIPHTAIWLCFIVSFLSTFLLVYFTFEFLIFREINNVYAKLSKIKKKDFKFSPKNIKTLPSANPIRRVNQEITAYAGEKQMEIDELRRMEVYRREFVADVSHELKTPIFSAQGFILTLLDGAVEDEKVRYTFLEKAAKSMKSLSILVEDLLTISQLESGDISMRPEEYDIQEQIEDLFEQLERKANQRNISLELIGKQTEGVYVYADYNRIRQVLINLIINAINYGNEGGNVTISLTPTTKNIKIAVRDNGNGIAPEHLTRIFERFYRVEKSRSKKEGGTGLGLAIVKHILEKHETKISVKSKIGEGTQFNFKLPKSEEIN